MRLPFILACLVGLTIACGAAEAQPFPFGSYPVAETFKGKARLPDFAGRDAKFRQYRTRILERIKDGPDFAGSLAIVRIGCGTGCRFAYVVNLNTGQVFSFPRGGEDNLYMDLAYNRASRLIVARWVGEGQKSYGPDRACVLEGFEWTGRGFTHVSTRTGAGDQTCDGPMF